MHKPNFIRVHAEPSFSVSVSAPGKIILHGEHSVVYGKLALAASIGLRTKLTLEEHQLSDIGQNFVNFKLEAVNLTRSFQLEVLLTNLLAEPIPLLDTSTKFCYENPESIASKLLLERINSFMLSDKDSITLSQMQIQSLMSLLYLFVAMFGSINKEELRPLTLTVTTDLNVSSGLGSSASFSVVVAAAFLRYLIFKIGKQEMIKNSNISQADLKLISRWAYAAEKIIHGTPSGLDNTICTYGSVVQFRKCAIPELVELHHKLKVLLINTRIPRDTKALITKVAVLRQTFPSVVDQILNAMDEISEVSLRNLSKLNEAKLPDQIVGVYDEIGVLFDMNQNLLRSLGVSHSTLDSICSTVSEAGLHGKLTGAGGGGYAIAVVPPNFDDVVLEKTVQKLVSLGFETVLTDLGGPGVSIH